MSKLKVGVIGVGYLGKIHARIYSELNDLVEFVGVHDTFEENGKNIAQMYNTQYFNNLDQLLEQVDAVSCAVPTTSHFETGMKVAEHGCHLLMEKPITANVKDGEKLVEAFKKKNLKLMVGQIERFNPAMEIAKKAQIEPMFIETHRLAQFNPRGTDVAVIYDLMIHDVDIILKFVKEKPSKIDAVGIPVITPYIDIANVRLTFPGGCVANITTSRISLSKMRKVRIFQPNSYIALDFLKKSSEIVNLKPDSIQNKEELYTKGFSLSDFEFSSFTNEQEPLKAEIKNFIRSVNGDEDLEVTGEDGLEALRVCSVIEEIIIKNKNIPTEPIC